MLPNGGPRALRAASRRSTSSTGVLTNPAELFTSRGVGTMIRAGIRRRLRQAKLDRPTAASAIVTASLAVSFCRSVSGVQLDEIHADELCPSRERRAGSDRLIGAGPPGTAGVAAGRGT
jgi:hypothetical protein